MAKSIDLKSSSYDGRYMKLVCEQTSNGGAKNTSTIKWTLSTHGSSDTWYSTGPTKVIINGTTVYSKSRVAYTSGTFPAIVGSTSGEIEVSHNTDGSKKIDVSFSTAIYTSTVTEYSDTWTLDSIPRYATSVQSVNSKTETSIKMNWSSDSTIDYLWYSSNNGSTWTGVNVTDGKSGTYTISGLSANTKYAIKTRVRRKDSQLTTDSAKLDVTTYDYPYCIDSPNFVLGDELTLKFYNPLYRAFKFYIIGNGTQIDVEYNCATTTYKGVNNTSSSVPYLYNTIPNNKSGKYKVKVVYGDSTIIRDNGNTYSINEQSCVPVFTAFTYKDTHAQIPSLTQSDQILVKALSVLNVEISASNKMQAKNGATPSHYVITIDTIRKQLNYSTNTISGSMGYITSAGTKRLTVTAYDSRGCYKSVYKDVVIYDYNKPIINISLTRRNNFEDETTLKVSGEFSLFPTINGETNNISAVSYSCKEVNGNVVARGNMTVTSNAETKKYTCDDVILSLDNQKAFEVEVIVYDIRGGITKKATVDVGQAVFFVSSNKKTAYLNGEEVTTIDNVRQTKYYNQLAERTDLNSVVDIGTYRSIKKADTDTMYNVPTGIDGGFTLYVLTWTSTPIDSTYIRQELIYGRMTYIRRSNDGGTTWSVWNTTAYLEDLYPVGSVYCSATNINPSSKLGGTWELIDKDFKTYYEDDTTAFTPATNVKVESCYISRSHGSIRIRLGVTINTAMTDTGIDIGTFNFDKVGVTNIPMGFHSLLSYSDGANGGIMYRVSYDGKVIQDDVVDATTVPSGNTFYLDIMFNLTPNVMLNSVCDKFYWKRTA